MWRVVVILGTLLVVAQADPKPEPRVTTALSLARGKAKPVRVIVKRAVARTTRIMTPCYATVTIDGNDRVFDHVSFEIGYAWGFEKPQPISVAVTDRDGNSATMSARFTSRSYTSSVLKGTIDGTLEHDGVTWTLSGSLRIERLSCLWDTY